MALVLSELYISGEGQAGRNNEDVYNIDVYSNQNTVAGKVADGANNPWTCQAFVYSQFATGAIPVLSGLNVFDNMKRKRKEPYRWTFQLTYKDPTFTRQTGENSFSFSTEGGTVKVLQSLQRRGAYLPTGSTATQAPDKDGGAINVTQRGVNGVEIDDGVFSFKTTFYVPPAQMTVTLMQNLVNYSRPSRVNSNPVSMNIDGLILNFAPGELRYRGSQGQKRIGFGDFELTMDWVGSPNAADLNTFNNNIPIPGFSGKVIPKDGWDYFWVKYQDQADTTANDMIKVPVAAYVDQVYPRADLNVIIPNLSAGQPPTFGLSLAAGNTGL